MLQIKLSKPSNEGNGGVKQASASDNVTVACPDHLNIADLPVAKSLGSVENASSAPKVKIVGRRSRRQVGERVHFCVQCDFPIAIYGRLIPCGHAFCLDCARSNSLCYLCDERVQKIQTIKLMEGIYICGAPHCFKSFLEKNEFKSHIYEAHSDLLPNGNESTTKPSASESTVQGGGPPQKAPLVSPTTSNPSMYQQLPNFAVPNQPQFGYPPDAGAQPFYDMTRSGSTPDLRTEPQAQPSLLGFPPPAYNFAQGYSQPWNVGPAAASSQGRPSFPPLPQGDGKGILAPQPHSLPPPPSMPPHN